MQAFRFSKSLSRRSRESGNPECLFSRGLWIPAFAGMTEKGEPKDPDQKCPFLAKAVIRASAGIQEILAMLTMAGARACCGPAPYQVRGEDCSQERCGASRILNNHKRRPRPARTGARFTGSSLLSYLTGSASGGRLWIALVPFLKMQVRMLFSSSVGSSTPG